MAGNKAREVCGVSDDSSNRKFVKKEVLNSRHHQDFKRFQDAIDGCLSDLLKKHRNKLTKLMTHQFQMWDHVSLLNA